MATKIKNRLKTFLKKSLLFCGSIFKIKNIIVFESHIDYSDNSRSFYEYLVEKGYNKKYKIYWFVNDAKKFKKREVENVRFLKMWCKGTRRTLWQWMKYFWIVKNAKFLIFSNRNLIRINKKTKTVWINHGIPIKSVKKRHQVPGDINYRVDSSEFCAQLEMDQNGLSRKQIIVVGNPRNDVIFRQTNVAKKIQEFTKFDKVILWLPTFRQSNNTNRVDSTFDFPLGIPIIYSEEALSEINDYLKEKNIALVLKLHPAQDLSVFKVSSLSNIIILNDEFLIGKDVELTEFYKLADALITDYSSVYVDYLLVDKPIGFTQDDFDKYTIGFSIENIRDYMPGQKIMDLNDLKKFIDDLSKGIDKYKKERQKICKVFDEFRDDKSSERLAERLGL